MNTTPLKEEKLDAEITAISDILTILSRLDDRKAARRVMAYVNHYVASKRPVSAKTT